MVLEIAPQPKNFNTFPEFEKSFKKWLKNCKDEDFVECQHLSANEIWEQEKTTILKNIKPGDKVQYGFKNVWEDGIFIEFYNPGLPNLKNYSGTFSYFEINVNGKVKRGYGKHQIRIKKLQNETI